MGLLGDWEAPVHTPWWPGVTSRRCRSWSSGVVVCNGTGNVESAPVGPSLGSSNRASQWPLGAVGGQLWLLSSNSAAGGGGRTPTWCHEFGASLFGREWEVFGETGIGKSKYCFFLAVASHLLHCFALHLIVGPSWKYFRPPTCFKFYPIALPALSFNITGVGRWNTKDAKYNTKKKRSEMKLHTKSG